MVAPTAEAPGAHATRRWPRRLLLALNLLLVLCMLGVLGGYAYLQWRFDQIDKIRFAEGTLAEDAVDEPMNVLLVGSDTRQTLTGEEAENLGRDIVPGQRSDTIMVLHIDPGATKAAILSIPRDLFVTHADTGRKGRINSTFDKGPENLIATITLNLGVEVHHYAQVDFVGFKGIVEAVGGVKIFLPAPVRDPKAGLDIREAGCITLVGDQALAWVRSRHFESLQENGRWKLDPTGDFGRISRQQDFIRRMMARAIQKGIRNPLKADQLIQIGVDNLTIDHQMTLGDLKRLAVRFRSLEPDAVDTLTLPVTQTRINGASVLLLKKAEAQPLIDRMNGVAPPPDEPVTIQPAEVRVRVLNGTGTRGQSTGTANALKDQGFIPAGTGNAQNFDNPRTLVRYRPGQRQAGLLVRSFLVAGGELVEDSTIASASDVVLVTGDDFAGVRPPGAPTTAPPPPTTAPPPPTDKEPKPTQPPGPEC